MEKELAEKNRLNEMLMKQLEETKRDLDLFKKQLEEMSQRLDDGEMRKSRTHFNKGSEGTAYYTIDAHKLELQLDRLKKEYDLIREKLEKEQMSNEEYRLLVEELFEEIKKIKERLTNSHLMQDKSINVNTYTEASPQEIKVVEPVELNITLKQRRTLDFKSPMFNNKSPIE